MFGPPVQAWYVLIAVSLASVAVAGIALDVTPAPAPPANEAAQTIDSVAAGESPAMGYHPLAADRVKIGSQTLIVAANERTAQASYRFGPVVPVGANTTLAAVLRGAPPAETFASQRAYATALADARAQEPSWQTGDRLLIRAVQWGEQDVTLVGVE